MTPTRPRQPHRHQHQHYFRVNALSARSLPYSPQFGPSCCFGCAASFHSDSPSRQSAEEPKEKMADVELQEQSVPLKSAEQQQPKETTEGTETTTTTTVTTTVTAPGTVVAVPQQEGEEAPPASKSKEKKGGGWFAKKKTQKSAAHGGDEESENLVSSDKKAENQAAAAGDGGGGDGKEAAAAAETNNVKDEAKKMKKDSSNGTKQQQQHRAKCPFSLCRGARKVEEVGHAEQQQMTASPWGEREPTPTTTFRFDLVQRDSAKLQETIDLGVQDIFGEPDAVHSMNGVWKMSLTVFLTVRNFCYKLLSLIFAVPLAVLFGILFGLFSMLSVFVFVPVGRLLSIPFGWLAKLWAVLISAVCDPLCRSFALTFGNVKVTRYGINQDPTAVVLSST
ncbi:hypothetical protein niasHS_001753 [Heterodera schachtii]|uniref:Caveolin n=1 Tax=Heterodera schachtii TaxID=97005 RepID=A0ABD2KCR9_HETSC